MANTIIVLGPPGSGKSSFANQLVAKTKPPAFKSSRPKAKA